MAPRSLRSWLARERERERERKWIKDGGRSVRWTEEKRRQKERNVQFMKGKDVVKRKKQKEKS